MIKITNEKLPKAIKMDEGQAAEFIVSPYDEDVTFEIPWNCIMLVTVKAVKRQLQ